MDQNHRYSEHDQPDNADVQGRRELVRKLGKFAVYATPFTVLALKGNAGDAFGSGGGGIGGGSGTGGSSTSAHQARRR